MLQHDCAVATGLFGRPNIGGSAPSASTGHKTNQAWTPVQGDNDDGAELTAAVTPGQEGPGVLTPPGLTLARVTLPRSMCPLSVVGQLQVAQGERHVAARDGEIPAEQGRRLLETVADGVAVY